MPDIQEKPQSLPEQLAPKSEQQTSATEQPSPKPRKRHRGLRIAAKVLMWLIILVLAIPVLLYLPPVQKFAIGIASNVVEKSTGMKIGIGEFRLSFPLDVNLKDVYVVEATGDTMVRAQSAIADVKLIPLFHLDVKLNRLQLVDGYYRMVSPDSSMIMRLNAGFLEVDDKSSVDIRTMNINLNDTKLRDGKLSLYMNVWKKKQDEEKTDTAQSQPLRIKANNLDIENFEFGMSMLPTIDTLAVDLKHVALQKVNIDLGKNDVQWQLASISDGSFEYITPTPEYIKTHPAPPSTPSTGPPMSIMGDSIAVDKLKVLYAVKGAKPKPGFDAGYLQLSDVSIGMRGFFNESSTVEIPLTRLKARERCGLAILEGSGMVGIDSVGLQLSNLKILTAFSRLEATAKLPFAAMAMDMNTAMDVRARGRIGLPDIEAFMPDVKQFTRLVPARKPLDFDIAASGTLANIDIPRLYAEMPGVVRLKAQGHLRNPLDVNKLKGNLTFDGALSDPALADKFVAADFKIPAFTISGTAEADGLSYGADFKLLSDAGNVAAKGHVALTPETYVADIDATGIDVARFAPDLGIGHLSASVKAKGRGFNPLSGTAVTDAIVDIHSIEYNRRDLRDIHISAVLSNAGDLQLQASSPNPGLDFDIEGAGSIHPDDYTFDINAWLRDVDLQALGLSETVCGGSGNILVSGYASPNKWLYDVNLDVSDLDWHLPEQDIILPNGVQAYVKSDLLSTIVQVNSLETYLDFTAQAGLQRVIDSFTSVADLAMRQVEEKNVVIEKLSGQLPEFCLKLNASGNGLLQQLLAPSGISLDSISADIDKDSILVGNVKALQLASSDLTLDTLTLDIKERGELLDYKLHLGNRPGTLDEFAQVNLNGYLGNNRVSAFLNQWNIKHEQGYRIGLTAALADSVVTAHITPLKSTIGYMPWQFNSDNFVDFNIYNRHIEANLMASSKESSILAKTQYTDAGNEELLLNISNLHIEEFLGMWTMAPPVKGDLNADIHVEYADRRFTGSGSVGLENFFYDGTRVGDFDLALDAGYGFDSSTDVTAGLKINGYPAISAYANLREGANGFEPDSLGVSLTRFPLKLANPFLADNVVLGGYLNGDMRMDGSFTSPRLNGNIAMDSVTARIPMFDATLRFGKDNLKVTDNVIDISNFDIFGANANPLSINGVIDAKKFNDINIDLKALANNFQLINSDRRSRGDLFGKVFLNLDAGVKGPLKRLNIDGNVNLLGTTDATYRLNMEPAQLTAQTDEGVVKFVNFNDTTQVEKADSIVESPLNMRINAKLTISPGTQLEVLLSNNGTDKVQVNPTANLTYFQNYMGDMNLNGTLTLGQGFARYSVPVIGEKMFNFDPNSTITWRGNVMNPVLNVTATDEVKANVTSGNNSRLVNFLVTLHATNTLEQLAVAFDLSTNDDVSIQNELQSMSADQRQTQAMNLLLYGQYMGQNTKASAASGNFLYSFLESQLNSWAAKNIRGVDLSFGVNQYDKTSNGVTNTETSYSYQVSKSLFNNRFKILVGGNYSTDAADDDIAENLVSDVAVEYILKQTQTTDMSVRLFRHNDYESILEGEITEMGAGFVLKRKLENLKTLFRLRRRRKNNTPEVKTNTELPSDSTPVMPEQKENK